MSSPTVITNQELIVIWMKIHELQAAIFSMNEKLEQLENEDKILWNQIEKLKKKKGGK